MTEAEFLARIDRHIALAGEHTARGNEVMARVEQAFERNGEAFERNREAFDRNAEAFDRNAEAFERNSAGFADQKRFMTAITDRTERATREIVRELVDLNQATRQHTDALARIFDRLDKRGL